MNENKSLFLEKSFLRDSSCRLLPATTVHMVNKTLRSQCKQAESKSSNFYLLRREARKSRFILWDIIITSNCIKMASNNNNSETVTLSKSQIKRKKRNAAKAKREAEAEAAKAGKSVGGTSTINSNKPASALNPHEKLRIAVQQKGYSSEDIDTALEEMWNLGLQYDELNAVLNFLDLKKAQKEADMEKDIAAKEATALVEPDSVSGIADPNENNLVEEQSAENTSQTEQATTVPAPVKEDLTAASASASAQDTMSEASNVNSEAPSETQPISLSSKLAVVANFEVLYDAVFALAEWITKAAKSHEVRSYLILIDDDDKSLNTHFIVVCYLFVFGSSLICVYQRMTRSILHFTPSFNDH